jgi:hypothetical protein
VIRTKREFYRLWRAGVLGNRPRTWATSFDLAMSGWTQPVVVRSLRPGGSTVYGVAVEIATRLSEATFNEMLDDSKLAIQGEVLRDVGGLALTYSTVKLPMKLALAERTEHAHGLAAKLILDHFLCPSSRDDLDALLDLYDGAVVEFGAYSCNLGDQPHRNTLFWECRNY